MAKYMSRVENKEINRVDANVITAANDFIQIRLQLTRRALMPCCAVVMQETWIKWDLFVSVRDYQQ